MSNPPGKKQIPIYIDEAIYRVFKIYSAETDQTIQDITRSLSDEFSKQALELASQIQEMRAKALQEKLRKEEEQRLANEVPLIVPGHEVDPIGQKLEEPISAF